MKIRTVLTFASIAFANICDAQTNAFPTSGNVGIGTTSPSTTLHINSVLNELARFEGNDHSIIEIVGTSGSERSVNIMDSDLSLRWKIGLDNDPLIDSGKFSIKQTNNAKAEFTIDTSGYVGIGTTTPDNKLDVKGTIRAEEVIVETDWSDFVFEDSYRLRSLEEVQAHIEEHGHLPDVPSASVVESEGLSVGETQKIMMQKIEELTLYMIEKDEQVADLQAKIEAQQEEIERLKSN